MSNGNLSICRGPPPRPGLGFDGRFPSSTFVTLFQEEVISVVNADIMPTGVANRLNRMTHSLLLGIFSLGKPKFSYEGCFTDYPGSVNREQKSVR